MINSVRGALFVFWMVVWLLILGVVFLPFLLLPVRVARFPLDVWRSLVFWGLRYITGIRVRIEGEQHLPTGGLLIASKHQSMFDVLIPWRLFAFPALIFKRELAWVPIFGWYVVKLKNVAINRKDGAKALRKMLQQCTALAKQGRQILIFPEGTRIKPGAKGLYKPGVAGLYKEMQVPCVPIALNSGMHWPGSGFSFRPGVITVRILPAIAPGLDKKTFMKELELRIETASAEINKPDDKQEVGAV